MCIYYGMATEENDRDVVTYLAVRPPKLRRSSVLLIGVLLFLVGVLLLVFIIIVLLFGLLVLLGLIAWLGWLMV